MALNPLCTAQVSVNVAREGGVVAAIRCKRWSCPTCREINRARVIAVAKAARPRALLTLTVSSEHYETPEAAAEALKRGLRLLRLDLKRHPKLQNFEFLAVFEKHESGYPHLHLLIKGKYLPWQYLRQVWERITGSYMVDIRKISSTGQAAMYCAKYIGKDLSSFPGCKRWWRSRGYSEGQADDYQQDRAAGQWSRLTADWNKLRFAFLISGWKVEKVGRDRFKFSYRETGPPDASVDETIKAVGAIASPWGRR